MLDILAHFELVGVSEKLGEGHSFFLVTSFTREELDADAVLDDCRERGTMEGRIGKHQSVPDGRLSSTRRPKSRIRNYPVKERSEPIDAERANAAALLRHGIAFGPLEHPAARGRRIGQGGPACAAAPRPGARRAARCRRSRRRFSEVRDAGGHVEDGRTVEPAVEGTAEARADRRSPLTPTTRPPTAASPPGGKGAVCLGRAPRPIRRAIDVDHHVVRHFVNKAR